MSYSQRQGKAYFQELHAIDRAWERYELRLGRRDLAAIANQISGGRATHLRGDEWLVRYRGVALLVVYSPATDAVVTFLPRR